MGRGNFFEDLARGLRRAAAKSKRAISKASGGEIGPLTERPDPGPQIMKSGLIHPRVFKTEKEAAARDMNTPEGRALMQLEADIMQYFEDL